MPTPEQILTFFKERIAHPTTPRELARLLRVPRDERVAFKRDLTRLVMSGQLAQVRGNRFALPETENLVAGRLHTNPGGFGFVAPDDAERSDRRDIYIAAANLSEAMHGDQVLVRVERHTPRGLEGRIVRILERAHDTVVNIGGVAVGGGRPVIIAGPCAVENERDTVDTAMAMRDAGVDIFRGGIFKPRTTPYNYQGIGRRGLDILAAVRERTGLPVMTEVMDASDIRETAAVCDALWVGARNMTNSALLKRLGQAGKPVMIKRGFASPIEELVRAAEFVIVHGNPDVVLCERGIQTFERYTRFTLDLAAVPALKELSHLPVIVDPSHGTGRRSLIETMARAAIAAGADGLMVESHVRPENMIKPGDDFQALAPAEVAAIVRTSVELREFLVGRPAPADARLQPQLG